MRILRGGPGLLLALSGCAAERFESPAGTERAALETDATIDVAQIFQSISGFGASSAWTEPNITDELADALFNVDKGIGLSLLRIQIKPSGVTLEGQTATKAIARGARVWAAPWSPPAEWKSPPTYEQDTPKATTAGGSLLPEHYQDWADRLADFAVSMDEAGTPLLYISAQNEPAYETPNWDTCTYTPSDLQTFVRDYLGPALAETGVSTQVLAPESQDWGSLPAFADPMLTDEATSAFVGAVATHGYGGYPFPYARAAENGKEFWMTEIDDGLPATPYDPGMDSALAVADRIHLGLTYANMNAWHYWWITGNKGSPTNGALTDGTTLSRRAYVLGNYAKFVRPGHVRVGASGDLPFEVSVSAYRDTQGSKGTIVAINGTSGDVAQHFVVTGGKLSATVTPWITSDTLALEKQEAVDVVDGTFDYVLPARSVTTFTGSLSDVQGASEQANDAPPPEPRSTDTGLSCHLGGQNERSGAPGIVAVALLASFALRRRRTPA